MEHEQRIPDFFYFVKIKLRKIALSKGFWLDLSEVSKSRDSSNRYFTEAKQTIIEALMHSTVFIILYFTLFQENWQTNKRFQNLRFVFIPEVNNKLTAAG